MALRDIEARELTGASTIVVSQEWWAGLSSGEQSSYRSRAQRSGIELRVDQAISKHFVEVRGGDTGPLSTERPM
ncbi:MAG TPA: hypothetical protein VHH32_01485 [Gemmatimonadales bacterium]|nr:hypothetical protein [Gemmatimonadales bacterium]